ncbi:hypothetical protein ACVWZV_001229 [Bradyrhizobium sp. GM5.1]
MEDEDIALNSVLGLELNRVFFAVRETANKQKIIEFARGGAAKRAQQAGRERHAGRTGELARNCCERTNGPFGAMPSSDLNRTTERECFLPSPLVGEVA